MSEVRMTAVHGASFQVAPSGVSVKTRQGADVFFDLGDLEQMFLDGMASSGWVDHFREKVRDLFQDVAACEVCGSIRGVRATGWDNTMLCADHAATVVDESRRSHGL